MKKRHYFFVDFLVVLFVVISLLISALAVAATDTPENKVRQTFERIESSLTALKASNGMSKSNIRLVLNEYLLPEVNSRFFAYKVLNKNLLKLSDELKQEFIQELSTQLINTYVHLLSKYNNEVIEIGQSQLSKSGKIAMVDIRINGREKSYKAVLKLIQSDADGWYFFDIIIEGISLVQTKQNEMNASFGRLGAEETLSHLKHINQKALTLTP
ncbi:MlaC/ttg2D family ABC transporter substrate-binding protein [Thalassomonas actiniarum]|uniref:ABC transporter substrate-binding protein n=1 Tax=Thalassomonas actiniarum TaxID=485447 RepID=A0AAE9YZH9_9GAMM|nr:ABC transporter substrate-binding protein [Thalassomonas actiniarum]WDE02393.1 ABC transporter substrate-binding protein [Thalassomonas actiniarum]